MKKECMLNSLKVYFMASTLSQFKKNKRFHKIKLSCKNNDNTIQYMYAQGPVK